MHFTNIFEYYSSMFGHIPLWIADHSQLLAGMLGWPLFAGVLGFCRWIICKKCSQPFIQFTGPFLKDAESFGRTFHLSATNVGLTGIRRRLCKRREVSEGHVEASFLLNGKPIAGCTWWTDPDLTPNGITLSANSAPHMFDLVTKRQGQPECNIQTVAIGKHEQLPANSDVIAEVRLFAGNTSIASSRWLIANHGPNLSDLEVSRLTERTIVQHPSHFRKLLWFSRIVPGIIAFEIVWDISTHGWLAGLELGGWLFSSAGAFVLAVASLWVIRSAKASSHANHQNHSLVDIEAVRLGLFLLLIGFILISVQTIWERLVT